MNQPANRSAFTSTSRSTIASASDMKPAVNAQRGQIFRCIRTTHFGATDSRICATNALMESSTMGIIMEAG